MAELTVNVDVTAINAAIAAEAAARVAGDAASVATASSDATTKANAAQAAAIASASTDATTKANAAQAAAISAASTDATTKANAAQAAAIAASQPLDSDLTAIAALTTTAYGRALLELASAAAARTAFGLWTTVMKTTTETRTTNNVLAADATLKLTMEANTKYALRLTVFIDTAATPDFKFRLAGPATPTLIRSQFLYYIGPASGGTTATGASRIENTYSASDITIVSAADQLGSYIRIEATIHNGANAGNFEFQWAQNTSSGSATSVLAGSYLKWHQV